jgi:hypothetical protein
MLGGGARLDAAKSKEEEMRPLVILVGLLAVAASSAAQECCVIEGVAGRGVAANEHLRALFSLSAAKATCEHQDPRVRGSFELRAMTERGRVGIFTDQINALRRDGTTVAVSGPALFVLETREGTHRVPGIVHVVAHDGAGADLATLGEGDGLAVHFEARDFSWSFRGGVVEGGIEVFVRRHCECTVKFAKGMGVAASDRQQGAFTFDVFERRCPEREPQVGGSFGFRTMIEGGMLSILMRNVEQFESDGHNAAFGGRAVAVLKTREGTREIPGVLHVRVADGDPDAIALVFESDGHRFAFEGRVVRGEIVVGQRG